MSDVGRMHRVDWLDANFDRDEAPALAHVISLGWLVKDTPDQITLAAERIDGDTYRDFTTVPRCCIVAIGPVVEDSRHTTPVLHGGADLPYGEAP